MINVYIDIDFYYLPCSVTGLDKLNIMNVHINDVKEGLKKIRIQKTKDGVKELEEYKNWPKTSEFEEFQKDFDDKIGCKIIGKFKIDPVDGNFHINLHSQP